MLQLNFQLYRLLLFEKISQVRYLAFHSLCTLNFFISGKIISPIMSNSRLVHLLFGTVNFFVSILHTLTSLLFLLSRAQHLYYTLSHSYLERVENCRSFSFLFFLSFQLIFFQHEHMKSKKTNSLMPQSVACVFGTLTSASKKKK